MSNSIESPLSLFISSSSLGHYPLFYDEQRGKVGCNGHAAVLMSHAFWVISFLLHVTSPGPQGQDHSGVNLASGWGFGW